MKYMLAWTMCLIVAATSAQDLKVVKYPTLSEEMKGGNELTVINFWATWCGPCIKELPYFEEANNMDNVRVMLVSLDFVEDEAKVRSFAGRKGLKSDLYLLDETDYDSYMAKVDEDWSGAIPATLIVDRNGKKYFYEQAFTREELLTKIKRFNN